MLENKKTWNYEFEKNKSLQPGQMLLSEPFMDDDNFRRSVILLCENDSENGTVGLILNRGLQVALNELDNDFPMFKGKVWFGGPVATDTLQFLHSLGDELEGTIRLSEHLYWGGNFEQLKLLIKEGKVGVNDVRFYLGYSGWSVGQLEEEMKSNSWIVAKASYKYVFQTPIESLWKDIMKDMGGVYNTMSGYPENPMFN
ncbi:MAG: YqgE/AlgH family protein [Bacteroidetes bacterium]|nr:YqgE/AlgH family protein [Bacteroidota bacterium]